MSEFLRGWQRKTGAILAIVTISLISAWIRSEVVSDAFFVRSGSSTYRLTSTNGVSRWVISRNFSYAPGVSPLGWDSIPSRLTDAGSILAGMQIDTDWKFVGLSFSSGGMGINPRVTTSELVIPYWSLSLPLAMISGWLIFSTPKKSDIEPPA